jgi:hypothetical protein
MRRFALALKHYKIDFRYGTHLFLSGLVVQCSQNASCDVVCGFGACNGINLDCMNSNYSCNLVCAESTTRTGQVRCNETQSCNCRNTCGPPYNCTTGVNCPGDICFNRWEEACNPYRATASALFWTYNETATPACDCACLNTSLIAADEVEGDSLIRYCADPERRCYGDSDCFSGLCFQSQCVCFYGWTGPRCDIRTL